MLEIEKYQNGNGYDCFLIQTDDGKFSVSFENNLDLYIRYLHQGIILDHDATKTIHITKENYDVYLIFDKLYNRIINHEPYDGYKEHFGERLDYSVSEYNPESLVKNGIVCWHSDDFIYENASIFSMCPGEDEYILTFQKSRLPYDDGMMMTFSVRIRNSGSRYIPYNCAFMEMYHDLKKYDPNYRQIHFEEELYLRKKLLNKGE